LIRGNFKVYGYLRIYIYMFVCTHMGSFWCFEGISIADSEDGRLESLDKVQMSHGSHGSQWGRCDMAAMFSMGRSCRYQKLWHLELVQKDWKVQIILISYPFTS